MPTTTGPVQTSDGYETADEGGATLAASQLLSTVQFTVANATVAAQVAKSQANDRSLHWDPFETVFAPGVSGYEGKVYGLRFRSWEAGTPAVVIINGYFKDDPIPFTDPQPFDGTLSPSGGFTPVGGVRQTQKNDFGVITVVNGVQTVLSFYDTITEQNGPPMLDSSDTVIEAGIYAWSIFFRYASVTGDTGFGGFFGDIDNNDYNQVVSAAMPLVFGNRASPSGTAYMEPGSGIDAVIRNGGTAPRDFEVATLLQRLSGPLL